MTKPKNIFKTTLFELIIRKKKYQICDTILLTGSPRSGTTWLGKALAETGKYCMVTEPFHLELPLLRDSEFSWRTYVPQADEWSNGKQIVSLIFQGRELGANCFRDNSPRRMIDSTALILKCVRANRLLPWLSQHVKARAYIHFVRHPCAVISSQMLHPLFPVVQRVERVDMEFLERYMPKALSLGSRLKYEEEYRALTWCLDQYIPMSIQKDRKWVTLSYEKLILGGESELSKLFEKLGLEISKSVLDNYYANSREAHEWSSDHTKESVESRLSSWKSRLNRRQIENILTVVRAFGFKGYSEDPIPESYELGSPKTFS